MKKLLLILGITLLTFIINAQTLSISQFSKIETNIVRYQSGYYWNNGIYTPIWSYNTNYITHFYYTLKFHDLEPNIWYRLWESTNLVNWSYSGIDFISPNSESSSGWYSECIGQRFFKIDKRPHFGLQIIQKRFTQQQKIRLEY